MATNFWKGDLAQFLLNKLALNDGTQIIKAAADPRVTAINAPADSLAIFGKKIYIKQDAGSSTNWIDSAFDITQMSTGLYTGGAVTIGAPTSTFSISDGNGLIIDNHTDPNNPTIEVVSWTGLTNLAVTNLATASATYVGIQTGGAVVQQTSPFTSSDHRDVMILGILVHTGGTVVEAANSDPHFMGSPLCQLVDLAHSIGFINTDGNTYSPNGVNLNMNRSAGKTFGIGLNFQTSAKDPNIKVTPSFDSSVATFLQNYRDGAGGQTYVAKNVIDPTVIDNDSGAPIAVGNNKWTVKKLHFDPRTFSNVVHIGQIEYSSLADAEASLQVDTPEVNDELSQVPLRGWLIVKKECVDLSDIPATAKFIEADKFGTAAAGGSTSATTTLQRAYENSLPNPEIVLNATQGSLDVRDNAIPLGTNLTEVTDNAGTTEHHSVSAKGSKASKYTHTELATIPVVGDAQDAMKVRLTDHKEFVYDSTAAYWHRTDNKIDDVLDFLDCDGLYDLTPFTDTGFGDVSLDAASFSGAQSLIFTGVAGDALDTFTFPAYTLDENEKGRELGDFFDTKYDGDLADYSMKIQESDGGWSDIIGAVIDLRRATVGGTSQLNFVTSITATEIRRVLVCNADNVGKILKIDNFSFQKNPFSTAKSVENQSIKYNTHAGFSTNNTFVPYFTNLEENKGNDLVAVQNTVADGFKITAKSRVKVVMGYTHQGPVATTSGAGVTLNATSGLSASIEAQAAAVRVAYDAAAGVAGVSNSHTPVFEGILEAEEYLIPQIRSGAPVTASIDRIFITVEAVSNNVAFKGHPTDTEMTKHAGGIPFEAVTTDPTKGTIVRDDYLTGRSQDKLAVKLLYEQSAAGVGGNGIYIIPYPNGYTVDTDKQALATTGEADVTMGGGTISFNANGLSTVSRTCTAVPYSTTHFAIRIQQHDQGLLMTNSVFALDNAIITLSLDFEVAISGFEVADPMISAPASGIEPTLTEYLSANVISAGVISDFTFSDLEVGRWYHVSGQMNFNHTTDVVTALDMKSGTTRVGYIEKDPGLGTSENQTVAVNYYFQASDTSFTVTGGGFSASNVLKGDGTAQRSYLQLTIQNKDGFFLSNMAPVNHIVGGAEYPVYNEKYAGKQVYAKTYSATGSFTTNQTLDSSFTGFSEIIRFEGTFKNSTGNWLPLGQYSSTICYPFHDGTLDDIVVSIAAITVNEIRVTVKYIK